MQIERVHVAFDFDQSEAKRGLLDGASNSQALTLLIAKVRRCACSVIQRWSQGHKARGQGHRRKCSPKKKKVFKIFFSGDLYLRKPKKRSLQIFRKVSGVFQRNFNGSKIVLSLSRGQADFQGLEASRPRTSKCVLEAKDVLEDSTSAVIIHFLF